MSDEINFEGKIVKPNKKGVWRCPYNCGDPRFPKPKWKTRKGFEAHMVKCTMKPSAVNARVEEQKKLEEKEKIKKVKFEIEKKKALEKALYKVGDTIYYVLHIVVEPTHEWRRTRWVRVRYEEKRKYDARTATVKSVGYDGSIIYNESIRQSDIFPTLELAKKHAVEYQEQYDEYVEAAYLCR